MKKKIVLFSVVIVIFTIIGLFQVNYRVQNLRKDQAELHRQKETNRSEIHVLNAEWAYLNEPERIRVLADKYLKLSYTNVAQLKNGDKIKEIYLADGNNPSNKIEVPTLRPILSSYKR